MNQQTLFNKPKIPSASSAQKDYGDDQPILNFDCLYQEFYWPFVNNATKLLGSDIFAHDIVQDVFIKYWTISKKGNTIREAKDFLFRMTFNLCRDRLKRRDLDKQLTGDLYPDTSAQVTQQMIDAIEYERLLQEAIALLPMQRRRVFVLGRLEGWSREKMAQALGVSEETIKEAMRQALKTVRIYVSGKTGMKTKDWEKRTVKNLSAWRKEMDYQVP